jgi:PAP2 superfamily
MPERVAVEIKLTINRSGTGQIIPHPARIPSSVFLALVLAYTAIAPNFDQPFISYAFASAVVFLVVVNAGMRSWAAAVFAALGFSLCHMFFPQGGNAAGPSLSLYAGMLGRGCLLVLGWTTIWANPEEGRRSLRCALIAAGIVVFVLASLVALNLTVTGRSRVFDSYLYVFDGSLGFQPSFVLGQFFARYRLIAAIARVSYLGLPVVLAVVSSGYLRSSSPWHPLAILTTAGVFGYLLYWVFPAMGPLYLTGTNFPNFPQSFTALGQVHPHAITLTIPAPRNAMPSLHMTWALLIWFSCRPFSRIARGFALAYVVLTVVATLGTGEHYLADLVVALPFSVAVEALWTPVRPTTRYYVLAGTTGLTLTWLVILRSATSVFLLSPAVPWGCILASMIASSVLERLLHRPQGEEPGVAGI